MENNRSKGRVATNALASSIVNPAASVVCTSGTGKAWRVQASPETFLLSSIKFVEKNTGWEASNGGILHTTNGGEKWTYELDVASSIFVEIWFVDRSNGRAITFTGNIYRYQALYKIQSWAHELQFQTTHHCEAVTVTAPEEIHSELAQVRWAVVRSFNRPTR